jgi:hypothetical protein
MEKYRVTLDVEERKARSSFERLVITSIRPPSPEENAPVMPTVRPAEKANYARSGSRSATGPRPSGSAISEKCPEFI